MQIEDGVVVLKIQVGLLVNGVVDIDQQSWNSSYVSTLNPDGTALNKTQNDNINVNYKKTHEYPTVGLHYNYRNVFLDNINAPQRSIIQGKLKNSKYI